MPNLTLALIGGGAMGSALLRGLITSGLFQPERVGVREPDPQRAGILASEFKIRVLANNQEAAQAEIVLLAIKPQAFATVVKEMGKVSPHTLIISIMAGIPLSALGSAFPGQSVIRAMPNTPALVGAGITALSGGPEVTPEQMQQAEQIFGAVGSVLQVPESQMDAVTALSGSGPGYVAVIAEALIDGGVRVGLPRPIATQLALQTLLGSAQLMLQENLHPALLKDQVTSPGGTTIAGIEALERGSLRGTLMEGIQAAWQRSRELGQG